MFPRQKKDTASGQADRCNFQPRFLFVSENTNATRHEVRAHVAREGRRRKSWRDSNVRIPRVAVLFPWEQKLCIPNTSKTIEAPSKTQARFHSPNKKVINELNASPFSSPSWRSRTAPLIDGERNPPELSVSTSSAQTARLPDSYLHALEEQSEDETMGEILHLRSPWCPHPSPVHILQRGNSDPFAAASITVNSTVNELMRWSRTWYTSSLWPVEVSQDEQSSAVVFWRQDMREAISDEASFHAVLAIASSYMATVHRDSFALSTLLRSGLRHKISSLASLRGRLRKNSTESSTLLAIVILGGAEFYAGDLKTTVLHLEAAKRIVDANGGLAKVATNLRSMIGIADSVTSWSLLKSPIFPVEDWDPGTWYKQSLSHLYFLDTERPGQHVSMTLVWAFNFQIPNMFLRDMLAELNELVLVRNLVISVHNRQHRNEIFRWLHVRRSAIKTYLLYHYLDVTRTPGSIALEDGLEAAVCLAAWYCHGFIIYPSLPVSIHFPPRLLHRALEPLLHRAEITASTSHTRLLLWLYFVGAVAEHLFGVYLSGSEKEHFTARFLAIIQKLELSSWQDVREVLESFLFDRVLDKHLVALLETSDLSSAKVELVRRLSV